MYKNMLRCHKKDIWSRLYFSILLLLIYRGVEGVLWQNNDNNNNNDNDKNDYYSDVHMMIPTLTLMSRNHNHNHDNRNPYEMNDDMTAYPDRYDINSNIDKENDNGIIGANRPFMNTNDKSRVIVRRNSGNIVTRKYDYLMEETPSCETLRAMWNYSRRRSRAAELTNEIPNYNQHYLTHNMPAKVNRAILRHSTSGSESSGGSSSSSSSGSSRSGASSNDGSASGGSNPNTYGGSRLPVFGRVLNREHILLPTATADSHHQLQPYPRAGSVFGAGYRAYPMERSPGALYRRYAGSSGGNLVDGGPLGRPSAKKQDSTDQSILSSFQKVKQLIWHERAKEQTQQRQAQDLALKAYTLRHLAQGEK